MARPKMRNPTRADVAPRQAAFLAAFEKCANITYAAECSKVSKETHYHWMQSDETYPERFARAKDSARDFLIDCAMKRATSGAKPSDLLLIFLMKGAMPEIYRDRSDLNVNANVSHSGQVVIQLPATESNDSHGPSD